MSGYSVLVSKNLSLLVLFLFSLQITQEKKKKVASKVLWRKNQITVKNLCSLSTSKLCILYNLLSLT